LFNALCDRGVVLSATSNVAPDNLYFTGLNRQLFLPFVQILKQHVDVINLDSRTDYRLEKLDRQPVYLTPLGLETTKRMNIAWANLKNGATETPDKIEVKGREIIVRHAVPGAARFSFDELCAQPLGATDYIAIVKRYKTVFIEDRKSTRLNSSHVKISYAVF